MSDRPEHGYCTNCGSEQPWPKRGSEWPDACPSCKQPLFLSSVPLRQTVTVGIASEDSGTTTNG